MELARTEKRDKILALQEAMFALPKERHRECEVVHYFAPGIYGRECHIPRGIVVVGKIHKHAHLNTLSKGIVKLMTEQGGVEIVQAPYTCISLPGTKRVVVAITDTIWTTFHPNPTDTQDLELIEAEVIAPSYAALADSTGDKKWLG